MNFMDEVPNNMATKGFAAGEANQGMGRTVIPSQDDTLSPAPFSLMTDGTKTLMYVPAYSLKVSEQDITPTGLTAHDIADWYDVSSFTSGLHLFIKLSDNDGEAGLVQSASFGATPPSGKFVDVLILEYVSGVFYQRHSGQVIYNQIALDSDGAASTMRSISQVGGTGVLGTCNFTLEVTGFRAGTDPSGCLLDGEDSYTHKIGVREHDGTCAEMRWVDDSDLAEAVGNWLVDNCSWVCDGGCSDEFCLTTEFITWYCGLDPAPFLEDADLCGKFWERGEDACVNYGSAIGDSCQNEVIDLDGKDLVGAWTAESSLGVCGNLTVNGCAYFCYIDTVNISACQWNGIFFDFCTTNGIVYWH
jgi:hypothetical protein